MKVKNGYVFDISREDLKKGELILPKGVKRIDRKSFDSDFRCYEITKLTLNEGLEEIGPYTFCFSYIKRLDCPDSLRIIGIQAFDKATELKEVNLNKVNIIGDYAFRDIGIIELYVPETIQDLGSSTFNSCKKLERVTFSPKFKLDKVDAPFFNCKNLKEIKNAERIADYGMFAFTDCDELNLEVNENINLESFDIARLKSITILGKNIDSQRIKEIVDKIGATNNIRFKLLSDRAKEEFQKFLDKKMNEFEEKKQREIDYLKQSIDLVGKEIEVEKAKFNEEKEKVSTLKTNSLFALTKDCKIEKPTYEKRRLD